MCVGGVALSERGVTGEGLCAAALCGRAAAAVAAAVVAGAVSTAPKTCKNEERVVGCPE